MNIQGISKLTRLEQDVVRVSFDYGFTKTGQELGGMQKGRVRQVFMSAMTKLNIRPSTRKELLKFREEILVALDGANSYKSSIE
jgi:DNA-directed RNA polymerase sigma subunit (sigma70/sigma32)